jgi:hypothetical protein
MKTKGFLLTFLFIGLMGFGLAGCEKEQLENSPEIQDGNVLLLSQISEMTQGYLVKSEMSSSRIGPWGRILGADLKGALRGFLDGYEIPIGTGPWHITVNGVGGAILGGVAASQEAAGLAPGSSGGSAVPHPGNEFDYVGALHYSILDEIYAAPNLYFEPNGHVNYPAYYDLAFGRLVAATILVEADRVHFPIAALEARHPGYLGNETVLAFSNGLNHGQYLPNERAILGQYFGALVSSHNVNDFAFYSIGVENAVSASTIGPKSKALLLIVMATARHGAAYWN